MTDVYGINSLKYNNLYYMFPATSGIRFLLVKTKLSVVHPSGTRSALQIAIDVHVNGFLHIHILCPVPLDIPFHHVYFCFSYSCSLPV